jgi:rfaE bifunctional protein kinase chain/domain
MNAPITPAQQFVKDVEGVRLLVIGDIMLDHYIWGSATRLSPEAPVPVLDVKEEDSRLGGAANVALNLLALGTNPFLCGVIGNDREGEVLRGLFGTHSLTDKFLFTSNERRTTSKTRVLGNRQQMLRLDKEDRFPISARMEEEVLDALLPYIGHFQVVIFEDYDKGMVTPRIIREITNRSVENGVKVVIDPKYRNFLHYERCTVFKPNLKELNDALNLRLDNHDLPGIVNAVKTLREKMPHENTLVTLSENGALVVDSQLEHVHIPAHFRQIADVSGAGDTVVSVLGACLASGMDLVRAARISNLAGGLVCEKVGVVPVELDRLAAEVEEHGF